MAQIGLYFLKLKKIADIGLNMVFTHIFDGLKMSFPPISDGLFFSEPVGTYVCEINPKFFFLAYGFGLLATR